MRLVFMGTPDFAVPSLQALVKAGHEVVGVYTQPDRPAGRGKQLKSSPVKIAAEEFGLPVFQPDSIKAQEVVEHIRRLQPECIVVVAYGQILPQAILALPPKGCINVHASLLPQYRGAAPVHWAIMQGEAVTGVTTMLMDEGLDTGDMLLKKQYKIAEEATTGEVYDALAVDGGELIVETLCQAEAGKLVHTAQTGPSSYAPLLTRETEKICWERSGQDIHNQIRGLNPWPGAFTFFRGEIIKVWCSSVIAGEKADFSLPGAGDARPGTIVGVSDNGLIVQTGTGHLLVREVQPAGKRAMPARDFFLGRHGQSGEQFG